MIVFLLSILISSINAKEVSSVSLKPEQILSVTLGLGKTTLLRFDEKPQKVIIGNKNYFNLEASENDIALQPLGLSSTNLFVYLRDHTYSFILRACDHCAYDDFIIVKRKNENSQEIFLSDNSQSKGKRFSKKLILGKIIIELKSIFLKNGKYVIDFNLVNSTKKDLRALDFCFELKGNDTKSIEKEFAFENFNLSQGINRGRLVFGLKTKSDVELMANFDKRSAKTVIEKGFL
ncbi:MAG: hypothetical protein K2Q26_08950 [Bdellovibrionales bacterium]|nr:hypothetical protein [Bdellovibrionales bacterium]